MQFIDDVIVQRRVYPTVVFPIKKVRVERLRRTVYAPRLRQRSRTNQFFFAVQDNPSQVAEFDLIRLYAPVFHRFFFERNWCWLTIHPDSYLFGMGCPDHYFCFVLPGKR